ncbi:MAG: DUF1326 domain-containing protein [Planctomycetota bacterium]
MVTFSLPFAIKAGVATIAAFAAVCALHHLPCQGGDCCGRAVEAKAASADTKLIANCVEARSASVFAGACHYNGELLSGGNEALLAISVESGSSQGVDLGGVCAAALVASDKNLKLGGNHRSIVYVGEGASAQQREAVVELLKERSHGELGEILSVEAAPLTVHANGQDFAVSVGDGIELKGVAMPDRACCKMPNMVWYEPLVPLKQRVVGYIEVWRVREPRLGLEFQRVEENSAFLGRLSFFDGSCSAPVDEHASTTN